MRRRRRRRRRSARSAGFLWGVWVDADRRRAMMRALENNGTTIRKINLPFDTYHIHPSTQLCVNITAVCFCGAVFDSMEFSRCALYYHSIINRWGANTSRRGTRLCAMTLCDFCDRIGFCGRCAPHRNRPQIFIPPSHLLIVPTLFSIRWFFSFKQPPFCLHLRHRDHFVHSAADYGETDVGQNPAPVASQFVRGNR